MWALHGMSLREGDLFMLWCASRALCRAYHCVMLAWSLCLMGAFLSSSCPAAGVVQSCLRNAGTALLPQCFRAGPSHSFGLPCFSAQAFQLSRQSLVRTSVGEWGSSFPAWNSNCKKQKLTSSKSWSVESGTHLQVVSAFGGSVPKVCWPCPNLTSLWTCLWQRWLLWESLSNVRQLPVFRSLVVWFRYF